MALTLDSISHHYTKSLIYKTLKAIHQLVSAIFEFGALDLFYLLVGWVVGVGRATGKFEFLSRKIGVELSCLDKQLSFHGMLTTP